MIITIDGVAGSGKSTLAQALAKHLGFVYLNTGRMYRTITAFILKYHHHLLKEDIKGEELGRVLNEISYEVSLSQGQFELLINGESFLSKLMDSDVIHHVSRLAAILEVRKFLQKIQRSMTQSLTVGLVAEGRDMGSVVFPQAPYKFYLYASDRVRAQRRFDQLKSEGKLNGASQEDIYNKLTHRDNLDKGREHSPLVIPDGATKLDSSKTSIKDLIAQVIMITKL